MLELKGLIGELKRAPLAAICGLLIFAVAFLGSTVLGQHKKIEANERECRVEALRCTEARLEAVRDCAAKIDSIRLREIDKTERQIAELNNIIKKMKKR